MFRNVNSGLYKDFEIYRQMANGTLSQRCTDINIIPVGNNELIPMLIGRCARIVHQPEWILDEAPSEDDRRRTLHK